MNSLQRLRGNAYMEYAPVAATLLPDGRHYQAIDEHSWHVVLHTPEGQAVGCSRYRKIDFDIEQLQSVKSPIAKSPLTSGRFRAAFYEQFECAKRRGVHYGEAGAWALSSEVRCSTAAFNIALMTFALAERLGGGIAATTATTRHQSSSILRRIGGAPIGGFAPYYDPSYDCTIELLQFDIEAVAPRYRAKLDQFRAELAFTPVVCPVETRYQDRSLHMPARVPFIPPQITAVPEVLTV
jgi:hypothetical protein